MKDLWNSEPTAILGLVQAGLTLFVCFGVHLTAEQIGAILTFSGTLLAVLNRSQVHSKATVDAIKQDPSAIPQTTTDKKAE